MALCQNGTLPKRQPRHSKLACFLVLADYIDYARARGRDSPPAKMAVCQNGSCCILIHPEIESQPVAFRYTLRLNLNLLHFTTASRMCPCVCVIISVKVYGKKKFQTRTPYIPTTYVNVYQSNTLSLWPKMANLPVANMAVLS